MGVLSRTKSYDKFTKSKEKAKASSDVIIKFLMPIVRWFFTLLLIYSVSCVFVVGIVPFTTAYIAGLTQISIHTDVITGLSAWGFPSLAATLLLTVLCGLIDYRIYKFFKKYLSYSYFVEKRDKMGQKEDSAKVISLKNKKK